MSLSDTATARHDGPTAMAVAAIAALAVVFDHELLGHGSVCLAIGGQVTLVSSALSRCSTPSALIDLGGPLISLTLGLIALVVSRGLSPTRPALRLGLRLVAAFAGFWESGYLVQAMATQDGDLYSAGAAFLGKPMMPWRVAGGLLGAALYVATLVVTARGLAALGDGRRLGRLSWVSAATVTVLTASVYRGGWGENLQNTILEIGVASLPLLVMPSRVPRGAAPLIGRSRLIQAVALLVIVIFALTQGAGLGDPGRA